MHIWYLYTQAALQLLQVDNCDLTKSFEYFLCAGDELGTELANILECGAKTANELLELWLRQGAEQGESAQRSDVVDATKKVYD